MQGRYLIIYVAFLFFPAVAQAQPVRLYTTGINNGEGRQFWFAYLETPDDPAGVNDGNSFLGFYVLATQQPAAGNATITETGAVTAFTAHTGTAAAHAVGGLQAYNKEDGVVLRKSVAVETGEPVALYALHRHGSSADVVNVLPVEALGDEYIVTSYNEPSPDAGPDMFLIIATEDATSVTVEPSVTTAAGEAAGMPFTIALDKGETYLVKADTNSLDGRSINGSYLKATKPVAVFVGNRQAAAGCDTSAQPPNRKHFFEQLTPLRLWGMRYILAPTGQSRDTYRITAAHDNTLVLANPYLYGLNRGNTLTLHVSDAAQPSMVIADKPVAVTLFGQTDGCGSGAPLMMRLNPLEHTVREASFLVPDDETGVTKHRRIMVFVKQDAQAQTLLIRQPAGDTLPLHFSEALYSDYAFALADVPPAVYRMENKNGFTAYVLGLDDSTAYGYAVAARYSDVPPPSLQALVYFVGQPATLPAGDSVASYHWYASGYGGAELPYTAIDMNTPQDTVLYASQKLDGNESARVAVSVIVKNLHRLYDYDTLVAGVAGSGMTLSSIAAGFTAHTVTDNMSGWATAVADNNGKLTVAVTASNNTTAERTGHIYINYGAARDTIVLLQPGKTCGKGTEGTEGRNFWVAFSENIYPSRQQPLQIELIATSGRDAAVEIRNPRTGWSHSFSIPANTIVTVPIPEEQAYNTEGERTAAKALYVQSSEKISLYANNFQPLSSDAANILPVEALGDEYYSLSYNANMAGSGFEAGNVATPEEFLIIATEDATLITIVPASETGDGKAAGEPYAIRMNKGESYLVKSKLDGTVVDTSYYQSITGSYIKANKLIAVFAGHKRAKISCAGSNSRDHLYEQLFPLRLWGTNYVVPSTGQERDLYRTVAAYDNTQWTINGVAQPPLQRGAYADRHVLKDTCAVITSSHPVAIALFTESMDCLLATEGDPFMIALNPVENEITDITYSPIPSSNIAHHYTAILVKQAEKAKTILTNMSTGQTVDIPFTDIPDSDYSYARVVTGAQPHHLENSAGFIAYAFGYGNAESYGYSVGARFNHLDYPPVRDTAYCINEPPKPLQDYDTNNTFLWYASPDDAYGSPTPPPFATDVAGAYVFYVSQLIECSESPRKKVTITVHPSPAAPDITPSGATAFCTGDSVTLHVHAPAAVTYEWYHDGQPAGVTASSFVATAGGAYAVKIADENGCTVTGNPQTVTVYALPAAPVITPLGATAFCTGGSVTLAAYTENATAYEWYREQQRIENRQANTCTVSEAGNYSAIAIDGYGCRSQQVGDALLITLYELPAVPVIGALSPCYIGYKPVMGIQSPEENVRYDWYKGAQYTGHSGLQYSLPALQYGEVQVLFVEAINAQGCRSRSGNFICAADVPPLFIPNVFTPNNDGINDNFYIAGLDAYAENELQIINKRGQVVYTKKNYYNEWYGDDQPTDTYYYYLVLIDKNGTASRHTGYVHLKRR
jgi:gliding motility-associated-like protein